MKEEKIYLASEDIATRAYVIDTAYRTKNGRYIISENALRDFRFRMTPEEYVTGLDVELISREEAKRLQAENGWAIGKPKAATVDAVGDGSADGESAGTEGGNDENPSGEGEGTTADADGNGNTNENIEEE